MKINNPNIDPSKPILINDNSEWDRISKYLGGLGYYWPFTNESLGKRTPTGETFPFYLICRQSKSCGITKSLDSAY